MKAALEKRAVEAELLLSNAYAEVEACNLEKQEVETRQKEVAEVAKKSLEDINTLKKQLEGSQAETEQVKVEVAKLKEEASRFKTLLVTSQEELSKSREKAKKAQIGIKEARAAVKTAKDQVTSTRKKSKKLAADLQAKLKQSEFNAARAIKKSQAKLQGLQAAVCEEIAQVESAQAQSERINLEIAEKAKQASLQMEAAMKEMISSCVPEGTVDIVYKQEPEKLNEVQDFQVQGLTSLTSKELNDARQDVIFYEAKNIEDVDKPVVLKGTADNIDIAPSPPKPALPKAQTEELTNSNISEAKQVDAGQKLEAFGLSTLDQQQYVKQNESEEELKRASEKVEISYVAQNAEEQQYDQIARRDAPESASVTQKPPPPQLDVSNPDAWVDPIIDLIVRDQTDLDAKFAYPNVNFRDTCSAATQKFMELARVYMSVSVGMITGDHKDTVINVIGRDQTFDLIGREKELIGITGKDQVLEPPVNDIDLSNLASIVGCGAVKKIALDKQDLASVVKYPFEADEYDLSYSDNIEIDDELINLYAPAPAEEVDTDTDGK